uniref:Uncharacterized protein n=1 Tax=Vitis vinifera TaxID=29760 RepID=F6GXH5_VITVI
MIKIFKIYYGNFFSFERKHLKATKYFQLCFQRSYPRSMQREAS